MRRREFVSLIGLGALAWPLPLRAQQSARMPRIGVLLPGTPASFAMRAEALRSGLRDLGHVEGQSIAIEWKWGNDRVERLPELAAELVSSNVEVIVTGGTAAAAALKRATATIPIVMAIIGDPVAVGLVDSLARPGGNATGFSIIAPELGTKRLELLKEIVPNVASVAVLLNSKNPQSQIELSHLEAAARALGLQLHPVRIASEVELDDAFGAMRELKTRTLIVLTDPILYSQRKRIVDLAGTGRLAAMYFFQRFAEEGGLMSYGPSDEDLYRRSATYVDRILKGAKAADLPVEQPIKFELVVNLKAARSLGLAMPESILLRADKLIE